MCLAAHELHFVHGNSIHGARREIMAKPIHDGLPSIHNADLMKENMLVDLSKQVAIDIVNLCTGIKESER